MSLLHLSGGNHPGNNLLELAILAPMAIAVIVTLAALITGSTILLLGSVLLVGGWSVGRVHGRDSIDDY